MAASLHALALLAMIGTSAVLSARMGPPAGGPRWLFGFLAGGVCVVAFTLSPGHLCDRGAPVLQPLFGTACVVSLTVRVRNPRLAAGSVLVAVAVTVGLSMHHLDLAHSPGLTGNSAPSEPRRMARVRERAEQFLTEAGTRDEHAYPEGWLHDAAFFKDAAERLQGNSIPTHSSEVEIDWLWHSWLTVIFARRSRSVALWFPGGTPSDAAKRLEWRGHRPKE